MEIKMDTENTIVYESNSSKENKVSLKIAENDEITMVTNQEYHTQGLRQANIGFYYSLVGGAIGFIILIISIFRLKNEQAYLGVVSGIIMDSISVIFFKISGDANKARTAYFDKLRDDTKRGDALVLCNSIENLNIKDNLKVKLALSFAGFDESKICDKVIQVCCNNSEAK